MCIAECGEAISSSWVNTTSASVVALAHTVVGNSTRLSVGCLASSPDKKKYIDLVWAKSDRDLNSSNVGV